MNLSTTNLHLTPSAPIDLQLHTTFSDGSWTVEALFDYLISEQFALVAITDHDCVDTAVSLQKLAIEKQLPILVAVEMSTSWQGKLTDLLCFGFAIKQNPLQELVQDLVRRQQENSQEVYENLTRKGCRFPPNALPTILAQPSSQQPHALFNLLKEYGYGLGDSSAGKLMMNAGFKYITHDPATVAEAAHQSGGVCLLAHPGRTDGFVTFDTQLLDQFRQEVPIDGLEVYYPLHTPDQTTMYQAYAERHKLLISAGSDSHGPDKPPIKYQAKLCRALLERLGIKIV